MKVNRIRTNWDGRKPVLNGWLSIASAFTAEIMAEQDYDSLTIDLQHGLVGYEAAVTMLQAMRSSNATPMVRVPWLDAGAIMKALDAGARGIICPMINNRAEAEQFVSYMRYPPNGIRSFGPTRAAIAYGSEYGKAANADVLSFAMIETAEAMANLDSIVTTPGLDAVYIGPADLTLGLTGQKFKTGFDREEPEMVEAIKRVLSSAKAAGIRAGLHCGSHTYAAKAVEWGFDLVTVMNDVRFLVTAAQSSVSGFRSLTSADRNDEPRGGSNAY